MIYVRRPRKKKTLALDILKYCNDYKKEILGIQKPRRTENTEQSSPEKKVEKILKKNGYNFIREYRVFDKYFDFMLPGEMIVIEVDGIYYHDREGTSQKLMHIRARVNDIVKNALAHMKGFSMVRIWEDETQEEIVLAKLEQAIELRKKDVIC